jgi:hypothetical protein
MRKPLQPGQVGVSLDYKCEPPTNPVDARKWIQEAIRTECYTVKPHVRDRLRERKLTMEDLLHAIASPRALESYPDMPRHGGTCWRLFGRDMDGAKEVGVGFEAYVNEQGRWAVVCTIFPVKERSWT